MTPVMAVIAAAVKLDGPGPVFFRQLRVGRHGRRSRVIKFRIMVPEAEAMKDSLSGVKPTYPGGFRQLVLTARIRPGLWGGCFGFGWCL
jgi:lipopolysaccharide/colanic/teichoic acid biosynthesis glycosyltransferase